MNLCVITYMYPGRHNQSDFAFVKQLVDTMAYQGHHISVVCPYNFLHYRKFCPSYEYETIGEGSVDIIRPWYLSVSEFRIGLFEPTAFFYNRALKRAFKKVSAADALYGHFWPMAFNGYDYARKRNIPLFVASGESEIEFRRNDNTKEFCDYVSGVICVSTKNKDESVSLGLIEKEKCIVLPNSIDNRLFKKLDKKACRKELNLPEDKFIAIFVGWFSERKGPGRVSEAIDNLPEDEIYSIFIGKPTHPKEMPSCKRILFQNAVPHNIIPTYLNAADVFILPTLHEGCCNAIVEAMACGLPIISSSLPFNQDVLNESNSIMVNPNSISEIASALHSLYVDKELRDKLSEGALLTANGLTIQNRASKIASFISNKMQPKV